MTPSRGLNAALYVYHRCTTLSYLTKNRCVKHFGPGRDQFTSVSERIVNLVSAHPLEHSTLPASNLRQEASGGQLIAVDLRKEVISLPVPHSLLPQAWDVPVLLIWCTCQAMIKPLCCFSILPLGLSPGYL